MYDKSTMEKQRRGEATDTAIELVIATERQRCIDCVPNLCRAPGSVCGQSG